MKNRKLNTNLILALLMSSITICLLSDLVKNYSHWFDIFVVALSLPYTSKKNGNTFAFWGGIIDGDIIISVISLYQSSNKECFSFIGFCQESRGSVDEGCLSVLSIIGYQRCLSGRCDSWLSLFTLQDGGDCFNFFSCSIIQLSGKASSQMIGICSLQMSNRNCFQGIGFSIQKATQNSQTFGIVIQLYSRSILGIHMNQKVGVVLYREIDKGTAPYDDDGLFSWTVMEHVLP